MKLPGILSVVALQAMARTPACSARNASRSVAAAVLCTTQAFSRPLTTTGLSGPSNRTSFFSLGILNLCSHQHAHRRLDHQNSRMWRIDDGGEFAHAVHAEIRNGRRAALELVGREFLGARARRQILHLPRN